MTVRIVVTREDDDPEVLVSVNAVTSPDKIPTLSRICYLVPGETRGFYVWEHQQILIKEE